MKLQYRWVFAILTLLSGVNMAWADQHYHYLEQNWSDTDRQFFYYEDQGSRLIAYDIFLNLEQAQSQDLFREDTNLSRLGLIPSEKSLRNPDALPIGVTRNKDKLGFSCAACHTQQVNFENHSLIIDGGQARLDLQRFLLEMDDALQVTIVDAEKFMRFSSRLLGPAATPQAVSQLKGRLIEEYKNRKASDEVNHTTVEYGYGRLDAFGAILNKALMATEAENNMNEPNAPTSYPYIWDTPQHDYVEWNGSQSNSNVGALARNIGEVIGVFGELETESIRWLGIIDAGYPSSIQTKSLRKLEKVVGKLYSPLWPEQFPNINTTLAQQGRALYQQYCISCHTDINRADPARKIKVRMSTLGNIKTDPLMAENAIMRTGKSGKLEGEPKYYFAGEPLAAEAKAIDIANNWMVGVIKNNPLQAYLAKKDAHAFGHTDEVHSPKYVDGELLPAEKAVSQTALLAYKARPLNGIWTSAPFLHNGSVSNLYEVLLPAAERSQTFYVGSLAFDPKTVGFDMHASENAFLFNTAIAGNSNAGHEYGTGKDGLPALTEDQRWALVEYMKTL